VTAAPLNHYQVLMLDPEVDADLLTTVYRRLVQRYQGSLASSGSAVQRLQEIERAYEVLREPHRRRRYDAELATQAMRAGSPDAPFDTPRPTATPQPAALTTSAVTSTRPTSAVTSTRPTFAARSAFERAPVAVPVAAQRPTPARTLPVNVLDFGRYAGWTLRQLAAHDPNYLEWLLRSPGGRQYRAEITALLDPPRTAQARSTR